VFIGGSSEEERLTMNDGRRTTDDGRRTTDEPLPFGATRQLQEPRRTILARLQSSIGFEWHIALPVIALTLFGLIMIYSAGGRNYFLRQLVFLPVAIAALVVCYRIPRQAFYTFAYVLYAVSIVLLMAVLALGHGPARRWFLFGPMNFQPSELAKIACVLAIARFASDRKEIGFNFRDLALPVGLALLPFGLVLIEPDLGSSVVFLPILGAILYWYGLRPFHLFLLFAPVLSLLASFNIVSWAVFFILLTVLLVWQGKTWEIVYGFASNVMVGLFTPVVSRHLHEYQKARITTFLAPWLDPKGMGWNVIQSQIAVGSGRWLGMRNLGSRISNLGSGRPIPDSRFAISALNFLPNRHTDFIFSCVGEEVGLVGSLLVLAAFCYLCYRFLLVASRTKDRFAGFVACGLTAVFAYHVIVNIAMTLGLAPITGIALPFLSYGGSPLLLNYMIVGLVLNVLYRPE
jgi:rod shape determining protein RodA